jgi:hypothetical protein
VCWSLTTPWAAISSGQLEIELYERLLGIQVALVGGKPLGELLGQAERCSRLDGGPLALPSLPVPDGLDLGNGHGNAGVSKEGGRHSGVGTPRPTKEFGTIASKISSSLEAFLALR